MFHLKNMKINILVCMLLFFMSGCNNTTETAKNIVNSSIVMPINRMQNYQYDNVQHTMRGNDNVINIVYYIEDSHCLTCEFLKMERDIVAHFDSLSLLGIEAIYIFSVKEQSYEFLAQELYNSKLKGDIYLDTCNAFMEANPQIPDNEMFHTFVINKDGKVLMVGNPFANEKMEALFKKVIAKERKKHKEIKKSV